MSDDLIDSAALREGIRSVLESESSAEMLHRFVDGNTPLDADLWNKAAELGWCALAVSDEHGGLGLGLAELAIVHEEIGRVTAPLPFLTTTLVTEAIAYTGSSAQKEAWLPRIAAGELPASLRIPEPNRRISLPQLSRNPDKSLVLTGDALELLDGAAARLLLVEAIAEDGASAFVLIEPERDGITIRRDALVDRTRHLASAHFEALVLSEDRLLSADTATLSASLLDHAALALACDAIGGADAIFELTLAYLKTREQFGRPIGSFQALKHRCSNMKVALEASRAVVADAVRKSTEKAPDASLQASLAKLYACDVAAIIAEDALQLHGGIGFAWEHSCHLYLKRAKLNQALGGNSAAHADRAAELLIAA
jgi:alkylation response protein AidB-like acyl-CoA dehydrogenase